MTPDLPVCVSVTKTFRKVQNAKAREQLLFKAQVNNLQFFSLEKAGQRSSFTGSVIIAQVHRERQVKRGSTAEDPQVQPVSSEPKTKESSSLQKYMANL